MSTPGYSGTPLAKKLGIKAGCDVLVFAPPENYLDLLAPIPENVRIVGLADSPTRDIDVQGFDVVHLFTNQFAVLQQQLSEGMRRMKMNGSLWVSWYKKAAKLPTEITEDRVRDAALPLGLVDIKVCAVDEKWSGLKLVVRLENRI